MGKHECQQQAVASQRNEVMYQGFTLIELLVVLVIMFGAVVIGIKHWSSLLVEAQLQSDLNRLMSLLNLARQSAGVTGEDVIICSSSNRITCSTDWQQELIVFVDNNNNNELSGTDKILRFHKIDSSILYSSNRKLFRFSSFGTANSTAGSIKICSTVNSGKHKVKKVIVSNVGRIRVEDEWATGAQCD